MQNKKDWSILTVSILSTIMVGYLLFVSVYEEVVEKNGGFFYAALFGGILLLAFMLVSLVTKLLSSSVHKDDHKKLWMIFEIVIIVALFVIFTFSRLRYTSSVAASDSVFYKAAEHIIKGTLSVGLDVQSRLIHYPVQYIYAYVTALVFLIFGVNSAAVIGLNTALLLLNAILIYRIVRRHSGATYGIISYITAISMPCMFFAIYSFGAELFFTFLFLLSIDLFTMIYEGNIKNGYVYNILAGVCGLLFGITLSAEPLFLPVFIACVISYFIRHYKTRMLAFYLMTAGCPIVFTALLFEKVYTLDVNVSMVLQGCLERFSPLSNPDTGEKYSILQLFSYAGPALNDQSRFIDNTSNFISTYDGFKYSAMQISWFKLGNHLLYMFIIVLVLAATCYLLRLKDKKIMLFYIIAFLSIPAVIFASGKENNALFFTSQLLIIACIGLSYMYENHRCEIYEEELTEEEAAAVIMAEEEKKTAEEIKAAEEEYLQSEEFLAHAREVVFYSSEEYSKLAAGTSVHRNAEKLMEDEDIADFDDAEEQNESKPIEFIENVMPLPKPHVHKELDFDTRSDDYDFDVPIKDNDDFDY